MAKTLGDVIGAVQADERRQDIGDALAGIESCRSKLAAMDFTKPMDAIDLWRQALLELEGVRTRIARHRR